MIFSEKLILSPLCAPMKRRILRRLEWGRVERSFYLLAIPEAGTGLLDLYPAKILRDDYYKNSSQVVIGIAKDEEEAKLLSGMILSDMQKSGESGNVEDYLGRFHEERE